MTEQSLIVIISLSGPERDYDQSVEFLGRAFRIVRVGTGGCVKRAIGELNKWSGEAAAIGDPAWWTAGAKTRRAY